MSYAATLPRPDTVSITVAGPSTALAYARALAAKAQGWAGTALLYVKVALRTITRIPKVVGNIALSALSTKAGYHTAVNVAGKAAGLLGRLASTAIRAEGRGLRAVGGFLTGLLRHVAPKAADTIDRVIDRASEIANTVMTTIESNVTTVSQVIGVLVRSPLVVVSTIRTAGLASGALVVHALTKGAAAARIVQFLPKAMTAVVWLTNPWKLLLGVAAVMTGAMAFAAFRLGRSIGPTGPMPDPVRVVDEPVTVASPLADEGNVTPVDPGMREAAQTLKAATDATLSDEPTDESGMTTAEVDEMIGGLRVEIGIDGSLEVHGIPAHLSEVEQRRIAQTAADAAAAQLHRIARRGRPISSAARRQATQAARTAVRASSATVAAAAA